MSAASRTEHFSIAVTKSRTLPRALHERLQELLDRQDQTGKLSRKERREATALTELDARSLTPQLVGDTLGALLKYQDDIARMQGDTLQKVLKEATSEN